MSIWGIIVASICYIVTAVGCLRRSDYAHALIWGSYALANMGFLIHELKQMKGE